MSTTATTQNAVTMAKKIRRSLFFAPFPERPGCEDSGRFNA